MAASSSGMPGRRPSLTSNLVRERLLTSGWLRLGGNYTQLPVQLLLGELSRAANTFGLLARTFFGWLLVVLATSHFPQDAFLLQLLFQNAQCLIHVVISDLYLHRCSSSFTVSTFSIATSLNGIQSLSTVRGIVEPSGLSIDGSVDGPSNSDGIGSRNWF